MFLENYHCHTCFSDDSTAPVESQVLAAIDAGISELCLTEHYHFNPSAPKEIYGRHNEYSAELNRLREKYAGKIVIKWGAELSEPHNFPTEAADCLKNCGEDFVIGSIHSLYSFNDLWIVQYANIDHCHRVYERYVDNLMRMARAGGFNVVGHAEYPVRYMHRDGFTIDYTEYEDAYREIFTLLAQKGMGIEINTSSVGKGINRCIPTLSMLKLYRECGGEILTIGSDAHTPDGMATGLREGHELAKEAGFEYITTFEKRKPSFIKI